MRSVSSTLACATILSLVFELHAQPVLPPTPTPPSTRTYSPFSPFLIPGALYAATGAPFRAEIVATWTGTGGRSSGMARGSLVVDRSGNQRFELPVTEQDYERHVQPQVSIINVVSHRLISLDPGNKTARVIPVTIGPAVASRIDDPEPTHPAGAHVTGSGESLGLAMIAGQEVQGWRVIKKEQGLDGGPGTDVRDLWLSTKYRLPLQEIRVDPVYGKVLEMVTRFEPGDPDPALFEVPAGYEVHP